MCVCNVMKDKMIYPCKIPCEMYIRFVIAEIFGVCPLCICVVVCGVFCRTLLYLCCCCCCLWCLLLVHLFICVVVVVLFMVCFVSTPLYVCCCCVVCGLFC